MTTSKAHAAGQNGQPFELFLNPYLIRGEQVLDIGCGMGMHAE